VGLLVSLQKLVSIGQWRAVQRPSLAEYAASYRPFNADPAFLAFWDRLRLLMGPGASDAALSGLQAFLQQNHGQTDATVCLSASCEISFRVTDNRVSIDTHDGIVITCQTWDVLDELDRLCAAHDREVN